MSKGDLKAKGSVELRPYTASELAVLYKVSKRTFNKWLKPLAERLGKREGYYYNIKQVRIIFEHLSLPGEIELE